MLSRFRRWYPLLYLLIGLLGLVTTLSYVEPNAVEVNLVVVALDAFYAAVVAFGFLVVYSPFRILVDGALQEDD